MKRRQIGAVKKLEREVKGGEGRGEGLMEDDLRDVDKRRRRALISCDAEITRSLGNHLWPPSCVSRLM